MTGWGSSRERSVAVAPSVNVGRPTIIDRYFERGLVSDAFLILAGAALTALLAQAAIPLWSASATGQSLGVLLVGVGLGAVRGALSIVLYLFLAAAGLPVLARGLSGIEHV